MVNSEHLSKRNVLEGADAVSMMVLKISMPSRTQFHSASQLSLEIRIEIQEWLPLGWDALLPQNAE